MPSKTIANLSIQLSAHTATLRRDFETAVGHVQKFGARLKTAARAAAKAFISVGVVVTSLGAAVAAATRPQWEAIAALGKLSVQTGAAVDQLSRMQFAADKLGIDRDDLTGAIEELNIRLGETIRDGIGPAAEAFDQLGLSAKELADLPLVDRLAKISKALAGIQNQATRGFLSDEIFGGDAFKILPLIRQGAEGIRALAAESDRLGNTVSPFDAKQVQAANAAIRQIQAAVGGVFRQVAIGAAPIITVLAQRLLAVGTSGASAGSMVKEGMEFVLSAVATAINVVSKLRAAFIFVQSGVTGLVAVVGSDLAGNMLAFFQDVLNGIIALVAKAVLTVRPIAAKLGWADVIDSTVAGMARASRGVESLAAQNKQFGDSLWVSAHEGIRKAQEVWQARPGDEFLADVRRASEQAESAVAQVAAEVAAAEGEHDIKINVETVRKTQGTAALLAGTTAAASAISTAMRGARDQALARKRNQTLRTMDARLAAIAANTKEQISVREHRI
jgi:hypothetical protein